jgi:CubicO group peptidase (beta-lactamase class C family)
MNRKLFFSAMATLLSCLLFAQTNNIIRPDRKQLSITDIDRMVKNLMQKADVTGLVLGMVENNTVSYLNGYGYKNRPARQPADTGTAYYAASFSKSLFAYLVMQLVDQGVLTLDKPLHEYLPKPLPEFPDYKDLAGDERWKLITARHCLDHTTGFPNWRVFNPRGNKKLEIFFTPGSRYAYSGEGLFLLQLVIETITHRSLEDLAQENIFRPFHMASTSYLWQPSFDRNHAMGHNLDGDTIRLNKRTNANAAGSMVTTIADFTRFVAAAMQGSRLSEQSRQQMFSPQIGIYTKHQFPSLNNDTTSANKGISLSYGLGWGLFKSSYGRAVFKEGHDDGWQNYTIAFPDQKYAVVIMTNSDNGESIFKELVEELTGITIPWEWEGYFPYKPTVAVPGKILQEYTGDYKGRFAVSLILDEGRLKATVPAAKLVKTNLHASAEDRFFLKQMDVTLQFVKGPNGKVQKILVSDEGENYELVKEEKKLPEGTHTLTSAQQKLYTGEYALAVNTGRTLTVEIVQGALAIKMRGQEPALLLFNSDTRFKVNSMLDIQGEFILQDGKVTQLVVEQNGRFTWNKVK